MPPITKTWINFASSVLTDTNKHFFFQLENGRGSIYKEQNEGIINKVILPYA